MKKILASLIVSATVAAILLLILVLVTLGIAGQPQILQQYVGTLSPIQGQMENIGIVGQANRACYIGIGNQDGKTGADFYKFDLKSKELTKLASFTDALREQSVSQILNNKLYVFDVFGSDTNTALTDGYVYDIQKDVWDKVASVEVDNKAIFVYGGNFIKLNEDEMLVIGGFNKEAYDWAVSNLGSLKD